MNNRGVILFAHNTDKIDYYALAVLTAERVKRFLNLPVTVITDTDSITSDYKFDNQIIIEPDRANFRGRNVWINRGRYQVGELSPYAETLVIDTDYLINSTELLRTFELPSDFVCYHDSTYLLEGVPNESVGEFRIPSYWATVFRFTKSSRTRDIFNMIEMIQTNYEHYANVYHFSPYTYRNDYALTIALRTVNGQMISRQDRIPGRLRHVNATTDITRISDTSFDLIRNLSRVRISDWDFHVMNKSAYARIAV